MEDIAKMREEIEDLKTRIDLLKDKIKELEVDDGINDGDEYFHSDGAGYVYSSFAGDIPTLDNNYKKVGNRFKTREECYFAIKRLEVLAKMKKFEEPDNRPWDGDTPHYYLLITTETRTIKVTGLYSVKCNDIYFETEAMAKKCIEAVGEEDLIKYYFKIKE